MIGNAAGSHPTEAEARSHTGRSWSGRTTDTPLADFNIEASYFISPAVKAGLLHNNGCMSIRLAYLLQQSKRRGPVSHHGLGGLDSSHKLLQRRFKAAGQLL